jgi:hypothetical protein
VKLLRGHEPATREHRAQEWGDVAEVMKRYVDVARADEDNREAALAKLSAMAKDGRLPYPALAFPFDLRRVLSPSNRLSCSTRFTPRPAPT